MRSVRVRAAVVACVAAVALLAVGGLVVLRQGSALELAQPRFEACIRLGHMERMLACVEQAAVPALEAAGMQPVSDAFLAAVEQTGGEGLRSCHPGSERIGALWARARGLAALDDLAYSCLGGPMHGVFYELGTRFPAERLAQETTGLCEEFAVGRPWVAGWDCRHGIGHALGLDARADARAVFGLCARVFADAVDQGDCATGAIASLGARAVAGERVSGFDAKRPYEWCLGLEFASMRVGCATRAASLLLNAGTAVASLVADCPEGDVVCAYGVGMAVGNPGGPSDVDRFGSCSRFRADQAEACVAGLVRVIEPDYWLAGQGSGVCARLDARLQPLCEQEVSRMHERELTLGQLRGREPVDLGVRSDPAVWPRA